jgi:uncharacterized protein
VKRAVVLHGYRGNPYVNWYPWLAWKLRKRGFKTWAPRLPMSTFPNGRTWTHKLLGRADWNLDGSLVIGHSAGAVEILNLLSNLPEGQKVKTSVLVSAFRPKAHWPRLKKLIPEPLDFEKIKANCDKFIFVIAADDPLVPVSDPEYFRDKLGGELIVLPTGGHFSILRNIRFWRFPELLSILEEKKVL